MLKSYFKEIVLKLAANGQSDKGFVLTSTFVPKGLSAPALGLYTCIKALKYIPGPDVMWAFTGPLVLWLNFFSSITTDFNISSALRWAIQDQWSSGFTTSVYVELTQIPKMVFLAMEGKKLLPFQSSMLMLYYRCKGLMLLMLINDVAQAHCWKEGIPQWCYRFRQRYLGNSAAPDQKEQSDQGLHCSSFPLHRLDKYLYIKPTLLKL